MCLNRIELALIDCESTLLTTQTDYTTCMDTVTSYNSESYFTMVDMFAT